MSVATFVVLCVYVYIYLHGRNIYIFSWKKGLKTESNRPTFKVSWISRYTFYKMNDSTIRLSEKREEWRTERERDKWRMVLQTKIAILKLACFVLMKTGSFPFINACVFTKAYHYTNRGRMCKEQKKTHTHTHSQRKRDSDLWHVKGTTNIKLRWCDFE